MASWHERTERRPLMDYDWSAGGRVQLVLAVLVVVGVVVSRVLS